MDAYYQRLVDGLRNLAPFIRVSNDPAWNRPPALRVIDCVLSLNRPYDRFVVPRLNGFEDALPHIDSISDLLNEMRKYTSSHEFVCKTLNYRHSERAVILGKVACRLERISATTASDDQLQNLMDWAKEATFSQWQEEPIRGFALAGFQYLRMLFGANTTKPDIRICQWVASVINHQVSPPRALKLLEQAAAEAGINLRDADTTIWEMLARKSNKTPIGGLPLRALQRC
jgi:hypothetical protein